MNHQQEYNRYQHALKVAGEHNNRYLASYQRHPSSLIHLLKVCYTVLSFSTVTVWLLTLTGSF